MAVGSWTLVEHLYQQGAAPPAEFVSELRALHDPEALGKFAAKWIADTRPFARAALLEYLARPLNTYRHEPLVKRLFKLAEAAGDDEVMGALLVAFDRSIRRQRKTKHQHRYENVRDEATAKERQREWEAQGFTNINVARYSARQINLYASRTYEAIVAPTNSTMPRPRERDLKKAQKLGDWERDRLAKRYLLFSLPTRRYLRRRAWRYFRKLGKADPGRYLSAAAKFLPRYRDEDVDSDIHLLDNWGLVHALFRDCPALERPAKGWAFAAGKGLSDLAFAPYQLDAWKARPEVALALLREANARTPRLFAAWLLQTYHAEWFTARPIAELLKLVDHPDADVSALGYALLETAPDLAAVDVSEWLVRLEGDDLDRLTRLSSLLRRRLDPARVNTADALKLAAHRARPVADLGFHLVRGRSYTIADAPELLALVQAESDIVRPAIVDWLRTTLAGFGPPQSAWVLDFLDSKFADVRAVGWEWLNGSTLKDDPAVWQKLMESPYQDVREPLAELLEAAAGGAALATASPATLQHLWATVLLNVQRGGRQKPGVVARVVARLTQRPDEAPALLNLLSVAVRSLRGPEFRAGLTGLVALSERDETLAPLIRERFPEFQTH